MESKKLIKCELIPRLREAERQIEQSINTLECYGNNGEYKYVMNDKNREDANYNFEAIKRYYKIMNELQTRKIDVSNTIEKIKKE